MDPIFVAVVYALPSTGTTVAETPPLPPITTLPVVYEGPFTLPTTKSVMSA